VLLGVKGLKVKSPDIYTGKPQHQRFAIRSGVLTGASSRWRGAISGRPLSERTDF